MLVAVAACLVLLGVASSGWTQTVGYTASVIVGRSTYDTEQATSVYWFNGIDVSRGPLRLSASVPVIRQRFTPVESALDPAVSTPRTLTGFGDPLIRLDLRVFENQHRNLQIGVAGSVKPAIVDAADGLGTGVADYAGGVSAFAVTDGTMVLADALFWKYGDPEGINFENSLSYSIGIGRSIGTGRWSTMASFAGFSPVGDTPPPLLLNVGLMTLTGRGQSLAITAGFGLTSSANDFSLGASWRIQN